MLQACDLKVRDVMTSPPETVDVETTLAEAYLVLSSERLSGAPIIDPAGLLVGVFSTTDLLADLAPVLDPGASPDSTELARIKGARLGDRIGPGAGEGRPDLVTCSEDASLVEACRLMVKNRVHRVIVVDERRSPIAVLSAIDVVRAVAALDEVQVETSAGEVASAQAAPNVDDDRPGL